MLVNYLGVNRYRNLVRDGIHEALLQNPRRFMDPSGEVGVPCPEQVLQHLLVGRVSEVTEQTYTNQNHGSLPKVGSSESFDKAIYWNFLEGAINY